MKKYNIHIDKFLCSCHKRAIKTLNYISNIYDSKIPKECVPSLHEYKGIYLNGKAYPGMNDKEIKELCPDIKLPENIDLSKGWYQKDHMETEEEFKIRLKEVINMFKAMAQNNENENYTICFISHNDFLNGFFSMLNNSSFVLVKSYHYTLLKNIL